MTDDVDGLDRWADDGGYVCPPPALPRFLPVFAFDTAPARTTLGRLRQIPDLVIEIVLTLGAPNPGQESGRGSSTPASRPPIDLAVFDLLAVRDLGRDEEHSARPLVQLAQCSRRVWSSLSWDQRQAHPPPVDGLRWDTEAEWLARVWPTALEVLTFDDREWVETEIRGIHGALAAAARLRREPRYSCPKCGGVMELGWGGSVLACNRCPHQERTDLEARYRRRSPMPTSLICAEFGHLGVNPAVLRKWKQRRKLTPADPRPPSRESWWWPWDVLLVAVPDIGRAVERREAARNRAAS